ncbi:MAG: hypothetical protein WCP29_16550 [Acidobacteriota bacterium]
MSSNDPLLAPMTGSDHREVAGVHLDIFKAGTGRVKRVIYPIGFKWDTHMKPITGTTHCMHTHVGFIARGRVQVRYEDGCTADFTAPSAFVIEPGHEGWVVGNEPAVMIEFDFEGETEERFGLPGKHTHK